MQQLPVNYDHFTARARHLLKKSVENILELAALCDEVRETWGYELYEQWVIGELGMSDWYAKNMLRIYERFVQPAIPLPPNITLTILGELAKSSTPSEAVGEILSLLGSGQKLTTDDSKEIIDQHKAGVRTLALYLDEHAPEQIKARVREQELSVRDAFDLVQRLQTTTPEVRAVALQHNVSDAGVIDAMEKIADKMPDEFAAMKATGFLPAEGAKIEPIPLADANGRDAADLYKHTRFTHVVIENEATRAERFVDERWAKVVATFDLPDAFGDDMSAIVIMVRGSGKRATERMRPAGRVVRLILQDLTPNS